MSFALLPFSGPQQVRRVRVQAGRRLWLRRVRKVHVGLLDSAVQTFDEMVPFDDVQSPTEEKQAADAVHTQRNTNDAQGTCLIIYSFVCGRFSHIFIRLVCMCAGVDIS